MPPKPRPIRKASTSAVSKDAPKDVSLQKETGISTTAASKAMLPPPNPLPPPRILEPDINALRGCLKNAAVKTGQIYSFYADTRKLRIQKYAPYPPRALTGSLGREVEKYDQLCDSIESHLLRAISVLQRDLLREERRIKEIQKDPIIVSSSPASVEYILPPAPNPDSLDPAQLEGGSSPILVRKDSSPVIPASGPVGRRPSAISISSLQRPPFPLKLDLSSTALRISAEEASLFSTALASPVTLAPKSARPFGPNELPADFMAAFTSTSSTVDGGHQSIDIDLTVPDTDNDNEDIQMTGVGSSADKPIELDLEAMDMDMDMTDMTDLFGDSADPDPNPNDAVDELFSPVVVTTGANSLGMSSEIAGKTANDGTTSKEEEKLILDALSAAGVGDDDGHDIFGSFGGESEAAVSSHNQNQHTEGLSTGEDFDLTSLGLSMSPGFFPSDGQGSEMNLEEFLNMGEESKTGT